MNRLGIESLNAGAPKLRLTGERAEELDPKELWEKMMLENYVPTPEEKQLIQQYLQMMSQAPQQNSGIMAEMPRGSYVQRRRAQMAGGGIMGSNAGSMLVAPTADGSRPGYGVWDKIKKRVGKLIPNELKSPVGAALAATAANYLPVMMGGENTLLQKGIGAITKTTPENNALDYMRKILGGGDPFDYSNVTGVIKPGMTAAEMGTSGLPTGLINPFNLAPGINIPGQTSTLQDALNYAKQYNLPTGTGLGTQLKNLALNKGKQFLGLDGDDTTPGTGTGTSRDIAWKTPMAIGAAAGAYQKKYLEDQPPFPGDETGINFQTGAEAMADPNLRFKPEAQYANVAEGGRIGYDNGGEANDEFSIFSPSTWFSGGPESETNPTMIGTQDSLFNRANIGVLKDAIRAYEAQKVMGELNEEQQADYDLKIKQLEALEQGAQGNADGGRIGYKHGSSGLRNIIKRMLEQKEKQRLSAEEQELRTTGIGAAQGGRIGYLAGGPLIKKGITEVLKKSKRPILKKFKRPIFSFDDEAKMIIDLTETGKYTEKELMALEGDQLFEIYVREGFSPPKAIPPADETINLKNITPKIEKAQGGRIGAQEGGLMDLGGMEKDYREEGGFVPIGGQEKADDVPARLSKNEFVFTADAVRNAGGGDIDAGAEVMENLMEHLEAGGEVSEDSQGLEGARGMFANAQQLEKRII